MAAFFSTSKVGLKLVEHGFRVLALEPEGAALIRLFALMASPWQSTLKSEVIGWTELFGFGVCICLVCW